MATVRNLVVELEDKGEKMGGSFHKHNKETCNCCMCKAVRREHITDEMRTKISNSLKGNTPWNKGLTKESSEGVRRISESKLGDKNPSKRPEVRKKNSESNKGKKLSEETIQKMKLRTGEKNGFYGKKHSDKTRKHLSERRKEIWKTEDYVRKIMKAYNVQPNKKEKKLDEILQTILPNHYRYVGDGQVILEGKNPDFINCNGQKKIIELFGTYWHETSEERYRKEHFSKYGYDTLIIWEHELKNEKELIEKIKEFERS